jgi:hypothetical protein
MIEDVPAGIGYPYTFTEYLVYYSPSEAMQPAIFWFNLTCDNGIVTDVNMQQP